ncbi:hypothetical protein PUN28_000652 [Cardiocondyla obscurior]|uniref:Uncharacterized protein n=1 Tax=Cardiocondyla obscurior TaxID=286306 RepID=A0AAW2H0H9_9HYME
MRKAGKVQPTLLHPAERKTIVQNSESTELSNLLHGSGRSRWDREKSQQRTWVNEERKSTSETNFRSEMKNLLPTGRIQTCSFMNEGYPNVSAVLHLRARQGFERNGTKSKNQCSWTKEKG